MLRKSKILTRASQIKGATLFVDWLQFYVNTTFFFQKEDIVEIPLYFAKDQYDFVFIKEKHGTPLYNSVYTCFYKGDPFFDVVTHPKHPQFNPPHLVQIRVHNHLLYGADMWRIIDRFLKDLRAEVHNITRLDLACDVHDPTILDTFRELKKENVCLKGGDSLKTQAICLASGKIDTQYIGRLKSPKTTAIYNKSNELKKVNKLYIKKLWHENEVITNDEQEVTRLEIRLKSSMLHEFNVKWENLKNKSFLIQLFKGAIKTHVNLYEKTYSKKGRLLRSNESKSIDILPKQIAMFQPLEKSKKQASDIIWRKKIHIKSCIEEYFVSEYDPQYFIAAFEMADEYGILDWFWLKLEAWIDYFKKIQINKLEPPDIEYLKRFHKFHVERDISKFSEDLRLKVVYYFERGFSRYEIAQSTGISVDRIDNIIFLENQKIDF